MKRSKSMSNEVYHWYGVWVSIPTPKMIALFESEKLALEFCNEYLKSGIRWQVNPFDFKEA
ncbi:MAG: hypothetical protein JSV88_00275 [Candidatus Aminicenantes bacterium]|nr:MAG: hypothetical protein JSV88_00275 [Candidatus Aminicenantes bacterium]